MSFDNKNIGFYDLVRSLLKCFSYFLFIKEGWGRGLITDKLCDGKERKDKSKSRFVGFFSSLCNVRELILTVRYVLFLEHIERDFKKKTSNM